MVLGSAMAQQCVEESTAREKQLRNTLQLVNDESDKKSMMIMILCNRLQELGENPLNIERQRARLAEIKQEKVAAVSAGNDAGGGSSSAGEKRKRIIPDNDDDDDEVIDVTPARADVAAGGSAAGGSAQPAAGGSGSGHTAVAIPKKKQKQTCLSCGKQTTRYRVVEQKQTKYLCQDCFATDIVNP